MEYVFEIPGSVDDYYSEKKSTDGSVIYAANRQRIRALVALRNKAMQDIIASGGNIHTASLDMNDQFDEFISTAPVMAQTAIYGVLAEELNAATAEINEITKGINQQIEKSEATGAAIGQWVGAGVLLIFFLLMMGMFT